MSPPSSARCRRAGWLPGCSTTSTAPTRFRSGSPGSRDGASGHAALVLPDPGRGSTQGTRASHRTAEPRSPARRKVGLCGSGRTRSRPDGAAGRRDASGHGVFARVRHPLCVAGGRRHGGGGAGARRRGGVVRGPGSAVRGGVDAGPAGLPSGGLRGALPHQGSRLRRGRAGGSRRPAAGRVQPPATDVALVRRGRARQRFAAGRGGWAERVEPALSAHQASSAAISAEALLLLDLWGKRREPGSVFADITWVGYTGTQVPERMRRVFAAVAGRATRP